MTNKTSQPLALLYVRVSTGRQVNEGHSLDSQTATLTAAAAAKGYRVEVLADEGKSASKVSNRAGLREALDRLDRGEAAALFVLDLDRLARSVADLSRIMDRAQRKSWALVVLGMGAMDTSTPEGRMVAQMLGAAAEFERAMVSKRVKRQHEARRARGVVWGVDAGNKPEVAAEVRAEVAARRAAGESLRSIAADLNERQVPTARGGKWAHATLSHLLSSPSMAA